MINVDRINIGRTEFGRGISITSTTNGWKDARRTVERSSVRVYRIYEWACEESEEGLQRKEEFVVDYFYSSESALDMSSNYWDLRSCWSIRRPHYPLDQFVTWFLEHEVVVSGGLLHVQLVAKFVHALLNARMKRGYVMRGGLVSLQIRKRKDMKRIDGCKKVKLIVRLKGRTV